MGPVLKTAIDHFCDVSKLLTLLVLQDELLLLGYVVSLEKTWKSESIVSTIQFV